jgi:D-alanyl-D-alanine carboxypeptidase (penicillin-binding protein 5/6)
MMKPIKSKHSGITRSILLLLLALIFLTSNIVLANPVFASASQEAESVESDSESNEEAVQNSESDSDAEESEVSQFDSIAEAAILIEASTGKVLYEKNSDQPLPPASITKVMTLLLGFEAIERGDVSWDDMVTVSEKAWKTEGSIMFIEVGTQVKLEDIITGISVVSANDGCIALAEHISGSVEAFVQQMNNRAQELGMSNSKFKNPHGLPEADGGHYMSARDISIVARELINKHPKILEFESMKDFTFNEIYQVNRNPLLGVYPGADGLKTGWTDEAGYCLVGTAEQNGMRLISVVMRTNDDDERLAASRELLDYGYQNYEIVKVVDKGDTIGEVDVKRGKDLTVPVKADESISVVIAKNRKDDIKVNLIVDEEAIPAPVEADTAAGTAEFRLDDELLGSTTFSTIQDVEKAGFFEIIWREIANFFRSLFKITTNNN